MLQKPFSYGRIRCKGPPPEEAATGAGAAGAPKPDRAPKPDPNNPPAPEVACVGSNDQPERPADDNETLCQPCSDSWFPRPDVTVLSWYEFPRALREIGIDESDLKDKIFSEMLDGQHFLPHVVEKDIAEACENFTQRYLAWQFLGGPADTLFSNHVVTELLGVVHEIRVRHYFLARRKSRCHVRVHRGRILSRTHVSPAYQEGL